MEFLFPSMMRSPFAHPSFAHTRREFRDPFDAPPRYIVRHQPHAIPRDDSDDEEDDEPVLAPSPPIRHASGPVRIPINFVGHSTRPIPPQPQVRPVLRSHPSTQLPSSPAAQARSRPSPSSVPSRYRAAEEVPPLHRESTDEAEIARREKQRMQSRLELYGLKERDVKGDGNCQFRALSDQLMGSQEGHASVRALVVEWLRQNAEFRIDPNTSLKDFLHQEIYPTWDDYCDVMAADMAWGDHITLIAAAELFRTKIWILSSIDLPADSKMSPVTIIEPSNMNEGKSIFLGHWHERHYTSLVQEQDQQRRAQ